MVDYAKKALLLGSETLKKVKRFKKQLVINQVSVFDTPIEVAIFCNDNKMDLITFQDCESILLSNYHRETRLKQRIERYLSMGSCIWLTLTFTNDILSKTDKETRRRYVRRYLKSQSRFYVANIDYGSTTEREHYHAVVVTDFVDMDKWPYGFAYTERIKNHLKTSTKISKYVSKLTNHAIKQTTKRECYIYSR